MVAFSHLGCNRMESVRYLDAAFCASRTESWGCLSAAWRLVASCGDAISFSNIALSRRKLLSRASSRESTASRDFLDEIGCENSSVSENAKTAFPPSPRLQLSEHAHLRIDNAFPTLYTETGSIDANGASYRAEPPFGSALYVATLSQFAAVY